MSRSIQIIFFLIIRGPIVNSNVLCVWVEINTKILNKKEKEVSIETIAT